MPKIKTPDWSLYPGTANPVSGQNDGPYADRALGDAVGLSQFGVRMERLPPGSRSSHRHWHEAEDEFVYVLSGSLVLIEETETLLEAGDAAGWAAGQPVAHCLENRDTAEAIILVVGTRVDHDVVHYPDHDIIMHRDSKGRRFTRTDGTPFDPKN